MTRIELSDDVLTIHLDGLDRLVAWTRRFDIPFDHLINVATETGAERQGMRGVAARLTDVIPFGTFLQQGGPRGRSDTALVLDVLGPRYSRLVLHVPDAEQAAAAIREACLN